jgi:hypothetical protein
MPSATLSIKGVRIKQGEGTAACSVVVNTRGEKGILEEPEEISVVPPAGGVSKVIRKSHGIASAVSYETD